MILYISYSTLYEIRTTQLYLDFTFKMATALQQVTGVIVVLMTLILTKVSAFHPDNYYWNFNRGVLPNVQSLHPFWRSATHLMIGNT